MPTYEDYKAKYDELGNYSAVAKFFNVHRSTVQESLAYGRKREARRMAELPDGVVDALQRTGIDEQHAKFGYRRVKDPETGSFNTVFWRMPDMTPQSVAELLRDALIDIPLAPDIALESAVDEDIITLIPIADAHIGVLAWAEETGEEWGTGSAAERLVNWSSRVLQALRPSSRCILLLAGDLFHADDGRAETPTSKHRLDVDGRYFQILGIVVEAMAQTVDVALRHHQTVVVRILPGNHDPHASIALVMALAQRYRENPRVSVLQEPSEFFVYEFGRVMIAAHHGHRAKAPQMVHFIADEYAEMWGRTKHRYLFTGHLHHHKSQDIGGMTWEQLPAITARDAYTVSSAYVARARLTGITYHRNRGEIARTIVGPEL